MECLRGKLASCAKTSNGVFFFISNSPQPKCHKHKKLPKLRVVKDILKSSLVYHSLLAWIKKSLARFGNGVMLLDHNATYGMQCSTQKVEKDSANHDRLFYACWKGKDDLCGCFEWKDTREDEDPFEQFCTVYFSNPPSYEYAVKETGDKFTSRHENCIKAYQEYLSLKTKEENL